MNVRITAIWYVVTCLFALMAGAGSQQAMPSPERVGSAFGYDGPSYPGKVECPSWICRDKKTL